jgi:hypothetical protein
MDMIVLVMIDGLVHGATNEPMASMLKDHWIKYCSNLNTIDKQLQLVVLFVPP